MPKNNINYDPNVPSFSLKATALNSGNVSFVSHAQDKPFDKFDDLLAIRQDIFNLYRKKGGEGALFQPESFWPHVTIGFDRRDLFIEDGIYKGSNYCYAHIHLVK
ncbi:hypothetical protein IWW56_005275 [Coemansia sp. RSA 2131]|nr:hypothetical protein IWW56_005275 [Coemansia sp. RSA 2131]